jgi:hypothetical protein
VAGDVRGSFVRLTEAQSAAEVLAACAADPRVLDPAFEDELLAFEEKQRAAGKNVDIMSAWRLVLRSVREGRNLYASTYEFLDVSSDRAKRDLVMAEPLLLEPAVGALLASFARRTRQQGLGEGAETMEARRRLLARFRAHGPVDGYFDILVTQLATADACGRAELRRENADLVEEFQRYFMEQGRNAARLGHHDRMQQLQLAFAVLAAPPEPSRPEPSDLANGGASDRQFSEDVSRLIELFMGAETPEALRDELLAAPESLTRGFAPITVAAVLKGELDRAALDRDVVRLRQLWIRRKLVLRCREVGVPGAFDELEGGELWPQPSERI